MRLALLATALLLLPAAARADWAWTSWTMGADTVVKASGRSVKAIRGQPGQRVNGWDLLAAGKTQQDGVKFRAEFFFDPAGQQLHVVKLSPKLTDCPALRQALTARYGAPKDESITLPSSRPIRITVLTWRDSSHGDFVAYSENPIIGALKAGCFVRYRPIAEADPPTA